MKKMLKVGAVLVVLGVVGFYGVRGYYHSTGYLMQTLQANPSANARRSAIAELAKLKDPRVAAALIAALQDTDTGVQRDAATALGTIGDPRAVEPLLAALQRMDQYGQRDVAKALGQLKDDRAILPVLTAMRNQDKDGQYELASALENFGERAIEPLLLALQEPTPGMRRGAVTALKMIRYRSKEQTADTRAVEPLIMALNDPDLEVRCEAADALGFFHDVRAAQPLLAVLGDPSPELREIVARVLSYFPATVTDKLIAALNSASDVRRSGSAEALGYIALPPGGSYLDDAETKMARTRAGGALAAAVQARNLPVVAGAYVYFIRTGNNDAVNPLIAALKAYGTKTMAETFLNSGHALLEATARQWAVQHGLTVEERTGGKGYRWGDQ